MTDLYREEGSIAEKVRSCAAIYTLVVYHHRDFTTTTLLGSTGGILRISNPQVVGSRIRRWSDLESAGGILRFLNPQEEPFVA